MPRLPVLRCFSLSICLFHLRRLVSQRRSTSAGISRRRASFPASGPDEPSYAFQMPQSVPSCTETSRRLLGVAEGLTASASKRTTVDITTVEIYTTSRDIAAEDRSA